MSSDPKKPFDAPPSDTPDLLSQDLSLDRRTRRVPTFAELQAVQPPPPPPSAAAPPNVQRKPLPPSPQQFAQQRVAPAVPPQQAAVQRPPAPPMQPAAVRPPPPPPMSVPTPAARPPPAPAPLQLNPQSAVSRPSAPSRAPVPLGQTPTPTMKLPTFSGPSAAQPAPKPPMQLDPVFAPQPPAQPSTTMKSPAFSPQPAPSTGTLKTPAFSPQPPPAPATTAKYAAFSPQPRADAPTQPAAFSMESLETPAPVKQPTPSFSTESLGVSAPGKQPTTPSFSTESLGVSAEAPAFSPEPEPQQEFSTEPAISLKAAPLPVVAKPAAAKTRGPHPDPLPKSGEGGRGVVRAEPAAVWRRTGAWLIDLAFITTLVGGFLFIAMSVIAPKNLTLVQQLTLLAIPGAALAGVLAFVYTTLFAFLWNGRTPGRRVLGIHLVDNSGHAPGPMRALTRAGLSLISFALFLSGFWLALFDRHGQTLHDKLTRTFVVRLSGA